MINPLLDLSYGFVYIYIIGCDILFFINVFNVIEQNELLGLNRMIVPFIACGDLR
jgi:hypothetical protein